MKVYTSKGFFFYISFTHATVNARFFSGKTSLLAYKGNLYLTYTVFHVLFLLYKLHY